MSCKPIDIFATVLQNSQPIINLKITLLTMQTTRMQAIITRADAAVAAAR